MLTFSKIAFALWEASKPEEEQPSDLFERPCSVVRTINRKYRVAVERSNPQTDYHYKGKTNYTYTANRLTITTAEVLARNMRKSGLNVLDIGTGNGDFIRENQKKYTRSSFTGVTAADMRTKDRREADEKYNDGACYQTANAEYLTKIFPDNHFDIIVSFATFQHFADPIGALKETYDRLKTGGKLIIDQFFINGCDPHLQAIIEYLKAEGYKISAIADSGRITNFVIEKTTAKPSLVFPLEYDLRPRSEADKTKNPVKYRLTQNVNRAAENTEATLYQQGCDIINERIKECKLDDALVKSKDYNELLLNKKFHDLPADKQQLLIMYVAATSITHKEHLKRLSAISNECLNSKVNATFLHLIIKQGREAYRVFRYSHGYNNIDQFSDLSLQDNCLRAIAVEDVIAVARAERMKADLAEMQIPAVEAPYKPEERVLLPKLLAHYQQQAKKKEAETLASSAKPLVTPKPLLRVF